MKTRVITLNLPIEPGALEGAQSTQNIGVEVDGKPLGSHQSFVVSEEGSNLFEFTPSKTTGAASNVATIVSEDTAWTEATIAPLMQQAITNQSIDLGTLDSDADAQGRLAHEFMTLAVADQPNW